MIPLVVKVTNGNVSYFNQHYTVVKRFRSGNKRFKGIGGQQIFVFGKIYVTFIR